MNSKVFKLDRTKLGLFCLVSLGLVALGVFLILKGKTDTGALAIGALCCAFFGACALVFAWRALSANGGITISAEGIQSPAAFDGMIPWPKITGITRTKIKRTEILSLAVDPAYSPDVVWRGFAGRSGRREKFSIVTSQLVGNRDEIAQEVQSAWERGRNLALASGMAVSQPEIKPQATLAGGTPVGTYGLMGLLVVVYGCEILYQVGGPSGLTPSVQTLAVLGGDMGKLVKDYGEYWRIFTAPLMHANPLHILFNGIALLFAGAALERIAGWKWLLGTFAISAICGEIATLLFVAPNIVGVGASGGIMGILAALLLAAQRLPDNAKRALQTNASSYLIPALLPIFSGGKNINYFAHAGGALAGVALGFVLWKFWRHDHPVPPLANVMAAAALGFIGVAVYAIYPISLLRAGF